MDHIGNTLVVDIGNTRTKVAVFEGSTCVQLIEEVTIELLRTTIAQFAISYAIVSNVGKIQSELMNELSKLSHLINLTHETALPFTSLYATPHTLGMDRVAGVAGALHYFEHRNILIIDAGTCITYDLIDENLQYHGGAISPGLNMRLKAMHHFTEKLPLVNFSANPDLIGNSTETSLLSGAFNGMDAEITEIINRYNQKFDKLQVILCGGDANLFGKHIKNSIFVAPNLVLYGLNKILLFNVDQGH